MEIFERIEEFIAAQDLTRASFERAAGLSNGYISKVQKGSNPGKAQIAKIIKAFPQLSREWLLNGSGSMLVSGSVEGDAVNQSNINGDNIYNKGGACEFDERREFLALLKAKDVQMDRLISVIEKLSAGNE